MKARVLEEQADLFEVGVLALTAEVQAVPAEQLLAAPSGPPVVIVGGLLAADRLGDMRRLSAVLGRAFAAVVVVPPFTDPDIGRYFETPVQLRVQRRGTETTAHVVDAAAAAVVADETRIRSDHYLETALAAGVIAVDVQRKPVLIRYQASNTQGPVFFSALQLLSYTALTDEAQRQSLLRYLLTLVPAVLPEPPVPIHGTVTDIRVRAVDESILVPVALLVAAGGTQTDDQLRSRALAHLGTELSADDLSGALEELSRRALVESDSANPTPTVSLDGFLEERGLHPYVRELVDLLAAEETPA